MKHNGYIGRIQNAGTQSVKAPCLRLNPSGKPAAKTGRDLRSHKK